MTTGERLVDVVLAAGGPAAPALVAQGRATTYAELAVAVGRRADELDLPPRSIVVLEATNDVRFVVDYLAVLAADHVPLLAGEHHGALAAAWHADAVIADGRLDRRPRGVDRTVHPALALLMSTSGSTGSPKLVRLSQRNLVSNARAIGEYLGLSPRDRAVTTLPLHYCYGLSVLHSHLVAGAATVLTTTSVVDPCFARLVREEGVTTVAGVPHTLELLERADPDALRTPSLRAVTVAGGRVPADRLRAWRDRLDGWGVDLVVMYGQTEATARMAYLDPELARRHPAAIGRAIPGGCLALRPVDAADTAGGIGELVYRGPNVMLGYATTQDDLAHGATIEELATGDLARHDPVDDVFEIVGRRARFVKPFGLRIDLDRIEERLGAAGLDVVATGDDERLVIGAPGATDVDALRARVRDLTDLPAARIVIDVADLPRLANGKVDHPTLRARALDAPAPAEADGSVAATYSAVLRRDDVTPASTFVALGGDSLSYVECAVRLEQRLGRLPPDWHLRSVAELESSPPRRRGAAHLDTTALLRAVGILCVVSTHMFLVYFPGGSHLMLAVVGYNTSRFHLSIDDTGRRVRAVARSMARLVVPTVAFVAVCMATVGGYGFPTLTLVNNYLGPVTHGAGRWHYWFVEAVVQLVVVLTALLAIGPVRRLDRRRPYLVPLAVLGATLVLREHWVAIGGYHNLRFQTHGVAWFLVLGWLIHRSTTTALRLTTTALCVLTLPGFFLRPERGWFIAAGLILLIWCREVPLPRVVIRPVAAVAASSMAIFITHFRIFPVLERNLSTPAAYAATIAAGVGIWSAADHLARWFGRLARAERPARPVRAAVSGAPLDGAVAGAAGGGVLAATARPTALVATD